MRKLSAVLCAGIFVLAGCGGGSDSTAATESTPERWDPCSITPEDLEATGLDPAHRNEGWGDGVQVEEWALCTYRPPGTRSAYVLGVMSSVTHTVQEAREKPTNIGGHDVVFANREGYQYQTRVGNTGRTCDVAIALPPGVVVFSVIDMVGLGQERICSAVAEHALDLQHVLPTTTQ